jgi:hypothetical protein
MARQHLRAAPHSFDSLHAGAQVKRAVGVGAGAGAGSSVVTAGVDGAPTTGDGRVPHATTTALTHTTAARRIIGQSYLSLLFSSSSREP